MAHNAAMRAGWRMFIGAVLFIPALSLAAQTIPAGFPAQSIWVSKANVTAGESVEIFTVVYNSSETSIRGAVTFSVDGATVGTQQFTLDSGKTAIKSTSWKATAGTHKFRASIEDVLNANGTDVSLSGDKTEALDIAVAEPPAPSAVEQSINIISTAAKEAASTSLPLIVSAGQTIFNATENFRKAGLKFAEQVKSANDIEQPSTNNGKTANSTAKTQNANASSTSQNAFSLSELSKLASAGMLFVFGSRIVFYPLLCLLALGVLYLLGRMVNRPRY